MPISQGRPAVEARALSTDWNRAVGELWTNLLLARGVERGAIVEIGPGFSDKIAFGLASLRFRGTIVLVEPNATARAWAVERYRRLLPHARVVAVAARLQRLRITERIDALLANHVLDDLLLDASISRASSARLFSAMRPDASCSPMFIDAWRKALADSLPRVDALARRVAASMVSMRPAFIALNHYPSWRHAAPVLAPIHPLSMEMMQALQTRLRTRGIACAVRDVGSMQWLTGWRADARDACEA